MLLVALASIGLTLWITWQLEGGAGAVHEAGVGGEGGGKEVVAG